jgi:uncharacterized cupin superfamily protein
VVGGAANIFDPEWDEPVEREGFSHRRARIGWQAGAERIGASLYELPPGNAAFPYHWHAANEEMAIVLEGSPTLRTPEGTRTLAPGDAVAFAAGEDGAHQIVNPGPDPARVLIVSTMRSPDAAGYPDSGKTGMMVRAPGARGGGGQRFWRDRDEVGYWEGERPPESPEPPEATEPSGPPAG